MVFDWPKEGYSQQVVDLTLTIDCCPHESPFEVVRHLMLATGSCGFGIVLQIDLPIVRPDYYRRSQLEAVQSFELLG